MTSSTSESGRNQAQDNLTGEVEDPAQPVFAPTQIDAGTDAPSGWWSESSDGQCSENAALFAASQPAPLSIV